ncbi:MAG: hydroxymethylglutaryl-CoA reductase, degradative [bacterium]
MRDVSVMSYDQTGAARTLKLGSSFRRMSVRQRRDYLASNLNIPEEEAKSLARDTDLADLANVMVESSVGYMTVPMGIAAGFVVNGAKVNVPLAVEEPSVVAAATHAGSLIARRGGGFHVETDESVMCAEVYLEDARIPDDNGAALEEAVRNVLEEPLSGMTARGGGFRGMDLERLDERYIAVRLYIDTRDAMGANLLNTAAEAIREPALRHLGGDVNMAILTNAAETRTAEARFALPVEFCARAHRDGEEMAKRIVSANRIANLDYHRAVTHNKGIMNGITSLALATANDTRAIEAACHAYAARSGKYRALTEYEVHDGRLHGRLRLPLAFGTVGGATGFHPASRFALRVLGNPDSRRLAGIAASVGLAQNFAAISALTGEGIQRGHMRLHANRLAWQAGARGTEIPATAHYISEDGRFNHQTAARALERVRREGGG